jgi:acetate kinase
MIKEGLSVAEVDTMLNKQSGLLGVSGLTSDMRELLEEEAENQDRRAKLAIEIFCRRVKQYIGQFMAEMPVRPEAVVFSGGIGTNAPEIRKRVCVGMEGLGLQLDDERNRWVSGDMAMISVDDSPVAVYMIQTDEELLIARDTYRVVANVPRRW